MPPAGAGSNHNELHAPNAPATAVNPGNNATAASSTPSVTHASSGRTPTIVTHTNSSLATGGAGIAGRQDRDASVATRSGSTQSSAGAVRTNGGERSFDEL